MQFFFVKKRVDLEVFSKKHILIPPADDQLLNNKIEHGSIYAGACAWEIIQASEKIGKEHVITLPADKFGEIFSKKTLRSFSIAGDVVRQLKKIADSYGKKYDQPMRVALINGCGTMLGDTIVGSGALNIAIKKILKDFPNLVVEPIMAWNCRPGVEVLIKRCSGVTYVKEHSVTLKELAGYDAIWDLTPLLHLDGFDSKNLIDFYLNTFGIDEQSIQPQEKRPYVVVPKKNLDYVSELLKSRGGKRKLVYVHWEASTPLRSMPIDTAKKIIEEIIKKTSWNVVISFEDKNSIFFGNKRVINLYDVTKHTFDNFISIFHAVDRVVTVDTVSLHIASGYKKPTLAYFSTIEPFLRAQYCPEVNGQLIPNAKELPCWGRHKLDPKEWEKYSITYQQAWSSINIQNIIDFINGADFGKIPVYAKTIFRQAGVNEARIDLPLTELNKVGEYNAIWGNSNFDVALSKPGIFIFHRQFLNTETAKNQIEILAKNKWITVLDIDDDPHHWKEYVESDFSAFRFVHAVSVSTSRLGDMIAKYNPNIKVLKNGITDVRDVLKKKNNNKCRVFFGALNRYDDWALIRDSINSVVKNSDHFEFFVLHDKKIYDEIEAKQKHYLPMVDYTTYLKVLGGCDVALLPLNKNQFNQYKSDLKIVECISNGVIPICSNLVYEDEGVFSEYLINGDDWGHRLNLVSKNLDQLKNQLSEMQDYVRSNRTHKVLVHERAAWYKNLINNFDQLEKQRQSRLIEVQKKNKNLNQVLQNLKTLIAESKYQLVVDICQREISLGNIGPEIYHYLGLAKLLQSKNQEAYSYLKLANESYPEGDAFLYEHLGVACARLKQYSIAIEHLKKSLSINANNINAYIAMGGIYNDLHELQLAEDFLVKASAIDPDNSSLKINFATNYILQKKYTEAKQTLLDMCQKGVGDRVAILVNLFDVYVAEGDFKNIEKIVNLITSNKLYDSRTHNRLGVYGAMILNYESALEHFNYVREAECRDIDKWNCAIPSLALGYISDGWNYYESRWAKGYAFKRPYSYAWWQGESLKDKTILVWGEQGLGDEILFANCFNDLIAAAKKVVIECDARLVSLFARSFPQALVISRLPEPQSISDLTIDYQIPAGSLPKYYRNSIDEFPKHDGYLKPNAEKVHLWKSWLDSLGQGLKVGISWRSMLVNTERSLMFTELKDWGQILEVPGVVFVNLQYDQCEEEILFVEKQHGVKIHRPPNINLKDDLDDVSALTKSLDLVISAPTSVRAMSGALGVKTWELGVSGWISLGEERTPWFPSVVHKQATCKESLKTTLIQVAKDLIQVI